MDRWDRLRAEIEDFRGYLCDGSPPTDVFHAYDFIWTRDEYTSRRPEGFPQTRGVYIYYDAGGTVLYVGKAIYTFDKRVWTHQERIVEKRYLDIIPFDARHIPIAHALEFFLITRFKPKYNEQYKSYDVPRATT